MRGKSSTSYPSIDLFLVNRLHGFERVLMQRALRINGKSIDLWCGYARLEWHYATKLRGRREVLGVDTQDDEEHGIIHLLRGAAPKLIFKQALQEIPDSVELRMEMLQISTVSYPIKVKHKILQLNTDQNSVIYRNFLGLMSSLT